MMDIHKNYVSAVATPIKATLERQGHVTSSAHSASCNLETVVCVIIPVILNVTNTKPEDFLQTNLSVGCTYVDQLHNTFDQQTMYNT